MSDEKEPENKNENDPYNFFKLSTDEPDPDNKDRKPHRFPVWTLMLVVIAALAFINMFMVSKPDDLIDFSVFRQMIADGKIVKVEMGENTFVGYGPEEQVQTDARED